MATILLKDLTPATAYAIQVRTNTGDGVSDWSRLFPITTTSDTTPPDVPAWAVSNDWVVSGDAFVATWQPLNFTLDQNKDFDHYEIELDNNTTQAVVRTINTSYTLTFDQNRNFFGTASATVKARIRSVDQVGNVSAWSAQKTATNPAPSAPASITVTALMESIKVEWATVSDTDLVGYKLQVSTTSSSSGFADVYNGPDSTYIHNTLMFTTDHWFRVYAVDKFGSLSTATTSGSVRPKSAFTIDTTPPATPASLTPTAGFDTTLQQSYIDLSWASVADADLDSYVIRYGKNGTNWEYISVPRENTTYRLLVDAGQSYYIGVTARDLSGNLQTTYRNASTYPITSTADTTAPSIPQNPTVVSNTMQIQVTITGKKADGVTNMETDVSYYEVYASTTTGFSIAASNMLGTIPVGPAMVGTFDVPTSGGSSTQTWFVKVRPVDRAGNVAAAASSQTTSTPGLIGTTNIVDASITNAKITDLAVDKLTAGTGLATSFTVKSTLTIGTASAAGSIQSFDWVSNTTGWKISSNASGVASFEVNNGSISAAALLIQYGDNIMPPAYADFEFLPSYYTLGTTNATPVVITTTPRYGQQCLQVTRVGTTGTSQVFFGTSNTNYNITVDAGNKYVVSAWVRNRSAVSTGVQLGIKWDDTTTSFSTITTPTVSSSTWTRMWFVTNAAPSTTSKAIMLAQTTTTTSGAQFDIDGIQVEPLLTPNVTTPSAWTPPGATTIDGGMIKTGSIQSTSPALDVTGAPIAGVQAWQINTAGNAVFGDALIRGKLVMGTASDYANSTSVITDANGNTTTIEDPTKLAGIGSMQSYNYQPGLAGWSVHSNGYAEFLQLKANSISADAIEAVSPDKLNPGTMTADLIIGTSIRSVEKATLYITQKSRTGSVATVTLGDTHSRQIGDQIQVKLDTADAAFDTVGKNFATITAVTDTTISYTSPSGSGTIGAVAATGSLYVEGRSVRMAPDGIVLLQNDGLNRMIYLPTDPKFPAYFSGDVEANTLTVKDDFLLQGADNAIAAGGTFTLNASVVPPSGTPTFAYSWDYVPTWMTNDFTAWKSGLWKDGSIVVTTNAFFGIGAFGSGAADGGFAYNYGVADDLSGEGQWPYGAIKANDGKWYVLVNDLGDGKWKVRRYATTGTGFDTLEATWVYDEHTYFGATTNQWVGATNPAMKDPVIGYGTPDGTNYYIYIARCGLNSKIYVSRYATDGTGVVNTMTNITDNQNLKSVNVGNFNNEYGAYRWVVTTEGNATKTATNYVFDITGTHKSNETFPSPNNAKVWGMCWNSTTNSFLTLSQSNRLYTHTSLAVNGTNVWYAKASFFDGNNSRTMNVSAVSGNATTTTVTTSSAHGYVAGDVIYMTGTGATAANNAYYTILPTGLTSTAFTFLSSYNGSTGAAGTVTNEWETVLSASASSTVPRRSKLTISTSNIPVGAGSNIPDRARFYFSNTAGGGGTYYRQSNSNATVSQVFTASPTFSGTSTTGTLFPAGTAAKIVSSNGKLTMTADGNAIFGAVQNANASADNVPALRLGDITSTHLRMGDNGIFAMSSNTVQSILVLNSGGQTNITNLQVTSSGSLLSNATNNDFPNIPTVAGGTANANLNTGSSNRLRLITSLSKYKMDQKPIDLETAKGLLSVVPKTFYDRTEWENNDSKGDGLIRWPGVIAEDVENHAPLFASYINSEPHAERELNGVLYDRLTVGLLVLVQDLYDEIKMLKEQAKS